MMISGQAIIIETAGGVLKKVRIAGAIKRELKKDWG